MTTQPTFNLRSIRVLLVTVALALASAVGFAASDVSAFVSAPTVSTGGAAGGGGGFGGTIDESARAQNLNALTSGGFADQVNESERAQSLDELTSGAVAEQASNPHISTQAF